MTPLIVIGLLAVCLISVPSAQAQTGVVAETLEWVVASSLK